MDRVYSIGMKKPKQVSATNKTKSKTRFFSSPIRLGRNSAPQRAPSPPPPQPATNEAEYLKVDQSSAALTIFTAEVDVKLSQEISVHLHRSMKKNPPRVLKYELIYVSPPSTSVFRDVNMLFRWGRTSMMQARKRVTLGSGRWVVFSGVCARTCMGKYIFEAFILSLTLAQLWLRPYLHC